MTSMTPIAAMTPMPVYCVATRPFLFFPGRFLCFDGALDAPSLSFSALDLVWTPEDHASTFYGKSGTDTLNGAILEQAGREMPRFDGRKKARFMEAGLIPLLLDESQGDGLIVSGACPDSNQQCLLNLFGRLPPVAAGCCHGRVRRYCATLAGFYRLAG